VGKRKGKENAQNEALQKARGDIIIFSDVATLLEFNAVRQIVGNFADPSIGCVSGMDKVISGDKNEEGGEGAYVKYEMWVRKLESRVNTVVGLSGSFFAARKDVCRDFSVNMDSDFRTLLNSRKAGMRGIVDPSAIGCYKAVNDPSREFHRKIRTVVRGLTVFFNNLEFCNCFRYGLFSWQYLSHKLLKWLVPFFLIVAFATNAALAFDHTIFRVILVIHCLFYCLAAVPIVNVMRNYPFIIKIPHFFISVNAAIAIAWMKFIRGERIIIWQPSDRK
jgi:cellulose synthase/poly-beta-1,6-N-acetylglucosamine synthase-like glycosyltransferase